MDEDVPEAYRAREDGLSSVLEVLLQTADIQMSHDDSEKYWLRGNKETHRAAVCSAVREKTAAMEPTSTARVKG